VELEKLIVTEETVGILKKSEENKLQNIEEIQESKSKLVEKIEVVGSQDESENIEKQYKNQREICNLCGDPLCPRKKGEPRKLCINYKKEKKEE
jgi:microcompartment protein CcmL/EutN